MQEWTKPPIPTQNFGVLLFEGFSNHCLANTVEPLRAANMLSGRCLYSWRFLSLTGDPVLSSSGMTVTPHAKLAEASGDMLIVMPSYGFRDHGGWRTQTALRSACARFCTLAGLDTGSWLLAEAGLLDGHRATIHWEELTAFAERFPEVEAVRARHVTDGNRITCSGAMAAFDLVLDLIGTAHGQALALEVAHLFMVPGSARSHSGGTNHGDLVVNKAVAAMQENLEEPLTIGRIARHVGLTQRGLELRMKARLGASPSKVYRRLRLNLARKLVMETDLTIAEIATRSGYENASAMTRAFRLEFGQTPRVLRAS